jgi:hypoxanthine phosphoribosyltransferase
MNTQPELKILISKRKIATAIKRLSDEIRQDYSDKNPLLVGILKGSFIFMADLVRRLDFALEIDFIRLSSYGSSTRSSGKITLVHELPSRIQDRHVLVVEDIVDSGLTTSFLCDYIRQRGAASIKLCSLTDKPSRRKIPITVDYLGFSVPDAFIVGYGIDWNEKYRNLPDIRIIEGKE